MMRFKRLLPRDVITEPKADNMVGWIRIHKILTTGAHILTRGVKGKEGNKRDKESHRD